MENVYGRTYAKSPNEFQFHAGDVKLIKSLVEHVKTEVDEKGENRGLHKFRSRKKKSSHSSVTNKILKENVAIDQLENQIHLDTPELHARRASLKLDLLRKTEKFLSSYGVDEDFVASLDESMVEVHFDGNQIYGTILCVICNNANTKNQKQKRVYYHQSPESSYWVMANFGNHLRGPHKLTMISEASKKEKNTKRKRIMSDKCRKSTNRSTATAYELDDDDVSDFATKLIAISNENQNETYEEVFVELEPNDSVQIISAEILPKADIQVDSLYKQMSEQITEMVGKVLTNGDAQETVTFKLDSQERSMSVAQILQNGNCLFAAICHQLSPTALDTEAHTEETSSLRQNVVNYILKPENYPYFEHELKNRVLELKTLDEIENITTECKLFTRFVLSQSGKWGGYESIRAIGEIFNINIIVIKEDGDCYVANRSTKVNERSILLAYRKYPDGNGYYHYDSICDIDAQSLLEIAKFIAK